MRTTEIVCHRGANEYAPENTYPAAQRCIEWGVDYLEIDVNRSRDGVFYLFHGPGLERTTNGQGFFPERSAAEIDELDAGSWFSPAFAGERVPRLLPFLEWVAGRTKLFLDIKAGSPAEIIDIIRHAGLEERCFVWSGSDEWALEFRRLAPDLQLKVNVRDLAGVIEAHERFGANIVEVGLEHLSHPLLDACRRRGLKTMVLLPGKDANAYRQALTYDVQMVNLDHADLFLQMLEEKLTR
ncbi:MAG: glycerophosphodiester phosphodiesterase family protein [Caldilineaceae bacterium]|nr:glycerophosphodiester phosphodiesterase family protein [Caldilineaceae bacterium]